MENEITRIKENIKNKRNQAVYYRQEDEKHYKFDFSKIINSIMLIFVITLVNLILLSSNVKYKHFFLKHIYESNFSFASVNNVYQKYFGSPLPFKNFFKNNTQPVFEEKLKYYENHKYKDGVKLIVDQNYLVPALDSGIVIFIGNKEDYNNTIIIQQSDGVDVWYSNIENINVKLYDYISKGSLLGEVKGKDLYLTFKHDGKNVDYKPYI